MATEATPSAIRAPCSPADLVEVERLVNLRYR
jgi:hypothetical protein